MSCNFGLRKKRDCTINVAKTKALISSTVTKNHTADLQISSFVFAYAKSRYSHDVAQIIPELLQNQRTNGPVNAHLA